MAPSSVNKMIKIELLMASFDLKTIVIVKLSSWINLDSTLDRLRKESEKAFENELRKVSRMGLSVVLIKLTSGNCVNTARLVSNKLQETAADKMMSPKNMFQVYVQLPMQEVNAPCQTLNNVPNAGSTWIWWYTFRAVCTANDRLGVALEISADLPSQKFINRWLGEPIRCIIIPTSVFEINKRGFPILPRNHQNLVRQFFKFKVMYIISPANYRQDLYYYTKYMDQLWNNQPADDFINQCSRGYEDKLGIPLQPLRDDLEPRDYEVFEKDQVKYTEYQKAIYQVLCDRVPEKDKHTTISIVMVVGAGRGPLVTATLKAAELSQRLVKLYAIDKNPKAIVTLLELKDKKWDKNVTVVPCDMRYWDAPEKADIIISELLGSFGDNELSPECLDGAQKFLKDGGIMVPQSYTSYLSPIQSQKLHLEASQYTDNNLDKNKPYQDSLEQPYGVRIHNKFEIHKPKPLFVFEHPKIDITDDNTRYKTLTYHVELDCILHGFAGYFEAILYKNVKLSIVPETHTVGMFSWFPIYFPIKCEVFIPANSDIEVHFWRCCDLENVWYEYCLAKPITSGLHNPNGRSYTIGLKLVP